MLPKKRSITNGRQSSPLEITIKELSRTDESADKHASVQEAVAKASNPPWPLTYRLSIDPWAS